MQDAILAPLPAHARYLSFRARPDTDAKLALRALSAQDLSTHVVGLGAPLLKQLGASITGLRSFPALDGTPVAVPATQSALWLWLRGDDRGSLLQEGRALATTLDAAFEIDRAVDGFVHDGGRDLTGYEDGTENPTGAEATKAAFANDGSSFVAVQHWVHDLNRFENFEQAERDDIIGRRLSDNEELDDAPPSAHVKRTAQEGFTPEAFVLRRSMPWSEGAAHGLVFVAFGHSFDAFEAQLRRMAGLDDGVIDALFRFTRPISGSHYWCPPARNGHLDLTGIL